ncbi:MAG: gliding motility-associated C-terminal domain-containing protein [Muribaculaceae bacterium]|nr:gliding motility-associated C-terminal domain-containing protein [Muribaculaceae bacterium]
MTASRIILLLLALIPSLCRAVDFSGNTLPAIEITPAASSGLGAVYVLDNTQGVSMVYNSNYHYVTVYKFSNLGAAYEERIYSMAIIGTSQHKIPLEKGDMGYHIKDQGGDIYIWITDYSAHRLSMESISPALEQDCARTLINFNGYAAEIPYYSINGRRLTLSRELNVSYSTLEFDETAFAFSLVQADETIDAINNSFSVPAPLCNTTFTLSGDRFLRTWGMAESIESGYFNSITVDAQTRATQDADLPDNQIKDNSSDDGLGGSAPCTIEFEAAVSDAGIYHEWQISRYPDFDVIDNSFSELTFSYTFTEQGTSYVRLLADNADATCPYEGIVYQVFLGESKLEIPNAFSPQGSPGVNDEWKVSYKSLVNYECHIFNIWGKELFRSTDPAQGWDGKSGGKYVPAGVYYYVIKARGADGVDYKRAGDINIINYNPGSGTSQSPGDY